MVSCFRSQRILTHFFQLLMLLTMISVWDLPQEAKSKQTISLQHVHGNLDRKLFELISSWIWNKVEKFSVSNLMQMCKLFLFSISKQCLRFSFFIEKFTNSSNCLSHILNICWHRLQTSTHGRVNTLKNIFILQLLTSLIYSDFRWVRKWICCFSWLIAMDFSTKCHHGRTIGTDVKKWFDQLRNLLAVYICTAIYKCNNPNSSLHRRHYMLHFSFINNSYVKIKFLAEKLNVFGFFHFLYQTVIQGYKQMANCEYIDYLVPFQELSLKSLSALGRFISLT